MSEDKRTFQVILYVSKMSKPVMIEKGCKMGDCHSLVVNERLAQATTNLENSFYCTRTQEIIIATKDYCEKHGIPLEIKDISGIVKGIKYLLTKRILNTPALEIILNQEKFLLNPSHPLDSSAFTKFLNKVAFNSYL
ncbi:MAG: hypothetical protein ACFFB2_08895 [Promethearchaeota archaeon]